MLHMVKSTNSISRCMAFLCGLLVATVLALLPISAGAQCAQWDLSGDWKILQGRPMREIPIELEQKGRVITGSAELYDIRSDGTKGKFGLPITGPVDGTIDGDRFNVQIFWANGDVGVYNGTILPSGRLDGEAYEKRSPKVRVPWHSNGVFKCAPPPPVIPKPIKSSGKAKVVPTPPPTPPFIIANQAIIPTPMHPFGIVPLAWDGGPDHPNVEVWLFIDNGAEIPAFSIEQGPLSPLWKQPKFSIAVQLQRYHSYRFVLKAAGKTLSTAAFVVP